MMVIKIAIVDDNVGFIKYAMQILRNLSDVEIDTYSDSSVFTKALINTSYDLVFIDYEMPGCNGLILADLKQLQSTYFVLITSHQSLTLSKECIKHQIFRYITKESFKEESFEAIREVHKLRNHNYLTVNFKKDMIDLELSEVFAVYSYEHYLHIQIATGFEYKTRMTIRSVKERLLETGFGEASCNTFINLHKIQKLDEKEVVLSNGSSFKISKNNYRLLQKQMLEVM